MVFFLLCNAFQGLFSQDALFVVDLQNHFYGLNSIIGNLATQKVEVDINGLPRNVDLVTNSSFLQNLPVLKKNV